MSSFETPRDPVNQYFPNDQDIVLQSHVLPSACGRNRDGKVAGRVSDPHCSKPSRNHLSGPRQCGIRVSMITGKKNTHTQETLYFRTALCQDLNGHFNENSIFGW